jgi:hypothetical protein
MTENPPWFLMPLADKSLMDEVNASRGGAIELAPLLDALAGLEELHRLGYVHRDNKPHNILHLGGDDPRWVLADFGLILDPTDDGATITSTSSAWGTAKYAAPEVAFDFHGCSAQSDIYSFGCVLHDFVGGTRVPYHKIVTGGALGAVMELCTEFLPQDRFPHVAALRSALVTAFSTPPAGPVDPRIEEMIKELAVPRGISSDRWAEILRIIERADRDRDSSEALLNVIDIEQIDAVIDAAPQLFSRFALAICKWSSSGGFLWAFCDVLGARLEYIFEKGSTRERAAAAVAALHLGTGHNRWSVMRRLVRMIGPQIDEDLADRLIVDIHAMDARAVAELQQVERIIHVSRNSFHPKIIATFEELETRYQMRSQPVDNSVVDLS